MPWTVRRSAALCTSPYRSDRICSPSAVATVLRTFQAGGASTPAARTHIPIKLVPPHAVRPPAKSERQHSKVQEQKGRPSHPVLGQQTRIRVELEGQVNTVLGWEARTM